MIFIISWLQLCFHPHSLSTAGKFWFQIQPDELSILSLNLAQTWVTCTSVLSTAFVWCLQGIKNGMEKWRQHNNAHIQSRKTQWTAFVRDFFECLFHITELFCSVSSVAHQHQQGGPHRLQPVSSGHHGIFNSGCVEATAACQDEASWITYSAIWPQEVITGAKVMVNFIRLPGDLSGTPFAALPDSPPSPDHHPPTHHPLWADVRQLHNTPWRDQLMLPPSSSQPLIRPFPM